MVRVSTTVTITARARAKARATTTITITTTCSPNFKPARVCVGAINWPASQVSSLLLQFKLLKGKQLFVSRRKKLNSEARQMKRREGEKCENLPTKINNYLRPDFFWGSLLKMEKRKRKRKELSN